MSTVIAGLSALLSLAAIGFSLYTFSVQRREGSYRDVDVAYMDLLKLALENPDLRNYERTSHYYKLQPGDPFRLKYDIYAYMCWNLIETIFDRQQDRRGQFHLSDTWVPVIIEENRLHYTWFKHNLRLFKPEFQRFVTAQLNDIDLLEGSIADLSDVYQRFERDFPPEERLDRSQIELLMSKKRYKLLLAKHRVFDSVIGYAFIYEPESPKVIWLDFMAIDDRFKSAGYGTLLFNRLAQHRGTDCLGVFLEVQRAESGDAQTLADQERRLTFYARLGARRLDVDYYLPTPAGAERMHLLFRPNPAVHLLPKVQIQEAIASAFDFIHSDIPHRDATLKRFISTIGDEQV